MCIPPLDTRDLLSPCESSFREKPESRHEIAWSVTDNRRNRRSPDEHWKKTSPGAWCSSWRLSSMSVRSWSRIEVPVLFRCLGLKNGLGEEAVP